MDWSKKIIIRENLKKYRLINMDPVWVQASMENLWIRRRIKEDEQE